ncbi:MAG: hypothetical protein HYS18_01385 [Burkholderiales bacterium]|nr:hypothetical protein [Burkholderiales bacterium]
MNIKRETLEEAASAGMLKYSQIDNLLVFLVQQEFKNNRESPAGRFNAALLYYLVGLLALGAAVAVAGLAVNALGMGALLWFAVVYALSAVGVAHWSAQRELAFPAAFFSLLAILLATIATFSVQALYGHWDGGLNAMPGMDSRWVALESVALAMSLGLLYWLRQPFLLVPTAFSIWLLGMDMVPVLVAQTNALASLGLNSMEELRKAYTLLTGLLLVMFGLYVDLHRRPFDQRFAFWAYFAGLLAFCTAVPLLLSNQLTGKLLYLLVHIGLVFIGAVLGRRVFEVFGGLGILLVLGDMSWQIFRDGLAIASALTLLSLVLAGVFLWWWRTEPAFSAWIREFLPANMQKRIETHTA